MDRPAAQDVDAEAQTRDVQENPLACSRQVYSAAVLGPAIFVNPAAISSYNPTAIAAMMIPATSIAGAEWYCATRSKRWFCAARYTSRPRCNILNCVKCV